MKSLIKFAFIVGLIVGFTIIAGRVVQSLRDQVTQQCDREVGCGRR